MLDLFLGAALAELLSAKLKVVVIQGVVRRVGQQGLLDVSGDLAEKTARSLLIVCHAKVVIDLLALLTFLKVNNGQGPGYGLVGLSI